MTSERRAQLLQFARFGVVGGVNTATYFVIYVWLVTIAVPYAAAAVLAFATSALIGYILHLVWTFGYGSFETQGLLRWLVLQSTAVGTNLALLTVMIHALGFGRVIGQLILLPVFPVVMFLLSRRWVFGRPAP